MYLSRVILSPAHPRARRALADGYAMHQLLWGAFAPREVGGPGRVLFRVETQAREGPALVLVQSDRRAEWEALGECLVRWDSKEVCLQGIRVGDALRFVLRANPTKRLMRDLPRLSREGEPVPEAPPRARAGDRIGLFSEEEQLAWLAKRGEDGGFRLRECRAINCRMVVSVKPGDPPRTLTHLCVDFEGLLEVTDPDHLRKTVAAGIGTAKGFGFGLLSLARADA